MSQVSEWLLEEIPNHHWAQVRYVFPPIAEGVAPVALVGIEYRIVSLQDEDVVFTGQLDELGQAHHEGVVPGPVAVYLAPQDTVSQRMAADKIQENLRQSVDSLAMLFTSQVQQFDQEILQTFQSTIPNTSLSAPQQAGALPHRRYSYPLAQLQLTGQGAFEVLAKLKEQPLSWQAYCQWAQSYRDVPLAENQRPFPTIVEVFFQSDVPSVLRLLVAYGKVSDEQIASAYLLLSDVALKSLFEQFLLTVWEQSGGCLYARAFVLDLINGLLIEVLLGRDALFTVGGLSLLDDCKQRFSSAALLLDEIVEQMRELIPLFYSCKLTTCQQGRTNSQIDIEWREPPNPQRCENHYANVALMPLNHDRDAVALGVENLIDNACVHGVTGELVLTQEDFVMNGPVPLVWNRYYRSSYPNGWCCFANVTLSVSKQWVSYCREDGVIIGFELPPIGKYSTNITSGLILQRIFYSVFVVKSADGLQRVFSGNYSQTLPSVNGALLSGRRTQQGLDIVEDIPLTQITNAFSEHWNFCYKNNQLVAVKSSWGQALSIEWNTTGQITNIINKSSGQVLAEYQWVAGGLVSVVTMKKQCWQYHYLTQEEANVASVLEQRRLISTMQSPQGTETRFQWSYDRPHGAHQNAPHNTGYSRWRCIEKSDVLQGCWQFQFVASEKRVFCQPVATAAQSICWRYSDKGLVLSKSIGEEVVSRGSQKCQPSHVLWQYEYDKNLQLTSHTDPLDNLTQYRYSPEGWLTAMIDPAGGGYSLAYDEHGRLQEYANALGHSWSCEYNLQGAIEQVVDPEGVAYRINCVSGLPVSLSVDGIDDLEPGGHRYWQWDAGANLVMDSANGLLNQAVYGDSGNLILLADRGQSVLEFEHDQYCQLRKISANGVAQLIVNYHGAGMIGQVAKSNGQYVDLGFDDHGRLLNWKEAEGTLTVTYDAQGRVQQLDCCGTSIAFQYGNELLPEAYVDATGAVFLLYFDERGLLKECIEEQDPDQKKQWQYDACGRQVYRNDSSSEVKTQYDALGRVTEHLVAQKKPSTSGANGAKIQCAYQSRGQLLQYCSPLGELEHEYDAQGFRIKSSYSKGYVIEYRYGAPGILANVTINGNGVLEIFRDGAGVELRRQQGGYLHHQQDDSACRFIDDMFEKKLVQSCKQFGGTGQRDLFTYMIVALQLGTFHLPPTLRHQLENLSVNINPLRGIAKMPEDSQLEDGIVVPHPVHGEPLLLIYQNQVYFFSRDINSNWRDWHGKEAMEINITAGKEKAGFSMEPITAGDPIRAQSTGCSLLDFVKPAVINSISLNEVF